MVLVKTFYSLLFLSSVLESPVEAFVPRKPVIGSSTASTSTALAANKPVRLADNTDGVVYVNDQCINCAACSGFAPDTFAINGQHHIVYQQPQTEQQVQRAKEALAACPVAAIRVETLSEKKKRMDDSPSEWSDHDEWTVDQMTSQNKGLFPRPFLGDMEDVYWLGHHNRASFGAVPYLVRARANDKSDKDIWIMVDTPKFSPSAVRAVTSLTNEAGPSYLFLTHVDDTADHQKWADHFPNLKRIFHSEETKPENNWLHDETLNHVEVLLPDCSVPDGSGELMAYTLDGTPLDDESRAKAAVAPPSDVPIILHTPGHSPGSISLLVHGVLFSGDTYAYTVRNEKMTGFPRYGNNLLQQAETLKKLLRWNWHAVAAGHGHSRDYRGNQDNAQQQRKEEMQHAMTELQNW